VALLKNMRVNVSNDGLDGTRPGEGVRMERRLAAAVTAAAAGCALLMLAALASSHTPRAVPAGAATLGARVSAGLGGLGPRGGHLTVTAEVADSAACERPGPGGGGCAKYAADARQCASTAVGLMESVRHGTACRSTRGCRNDGAEYVQ